MRMENLHLLKKMKQIMIDIEDQSKKIGINLQLRRELDGTMSDINELVRRYCVDNDSVAGASIEACNYYLSELSTLASEFAGSVVYSPERELISIHFELLRDYEFGRNYNVDIVFYTVDIADFNEFVGKIRALYLEVKRLKDDNFHKDIILQKLKDFINDLEKYG